MTTSIISMSPILTILHYILHIVRQVQRIEHNSILYSSKTSPLSGVMITIPDCLLEQMPAFFVTYSEKF